MLFNKLAFGLPNLSYPVGKLPLTYTNHALKEAEKDQYGRFSDRLPSVLDVSKADLREVETKPGRKGEKVSKLVYRLQLDNSRDIHLVVLPENGNWIVKTCWLDTQRHRNKRLNLERYSRPKI